MNNTKYNWIELLSDTAALAWSPDIWARAQRWLDTFESWRSRGKRGTIPTPRELADFCNTRSDQDNQSAVTYTRALFQVLESKNLVTHEQTEDAIDTIQRARGTAPAKRMQDAELTLSQVRTWGLAQPLGSMDRYVALGLSAGLTRLALSVTPTEQIIALGLDPELSECAEKLCQKPTYWHVSQACKRMFASCPFADSVRLARLRPRELTSLSRDLFKKNKP